MSPRRSAEPAEFLEFLGSEPQSKAAVAEHNLAHPASDRPPARTRGQLPASSGASHGVRHEPDEPKKLVLSHPDAQRPPEEMYASLPVTHYSAARVVGCQYRCWKPRIHVALTVLCRPTAYENHSQRRSIFTAPLEGNLCLRSVRGRRVATGPAEATPARLAHGPHGNLLHRRLAGLTVAHLLVQ